MIRVHLPCCHFVSNSSFLLCSLLPSSCSRLCPSLVHCWALRPGLCGGRFTEQIKLWCWESSRPEKSRAAEDSDPSPLSLPFSCLLSQVPTPSDPHQPFYSILWPTPSHFLFLQRQRPCPFSCNTSAPWMITVAEGSWRSPSWLQRQPQVFIPYMAVVLLLFIPPLTLEDKISL